MNNRTNACSKYREEILRKSSAKKRKKSNNKNDDCLEIKSLCDKCPKKKFKKIVKSSDVSRNDSKCNKLLATIKPPLSVREKYANLQHVVCFAEKRQNTISQKQNGIIYTAANSKSCEGEIQKSNRKKVTNGGNSWCKTSSEDKLSKSLEPKCDSVCSFDTVINLEGFTLTSEELKKIEKNRLDVHPPKENEKELDEKVKEDQDNVQNPTEIKEPEVSEEMPVDETPVEESVEETDIENKE